MTTSVGLTDVERELLLDLLLREHRELPVEIHHTKQREVHVGLTERLRVVTDLIKKMQQLQPAG